MIWLCNINNLLYTVKDGCVRCKHVREKRWHTSSYGADVKTFLDNAKSERFTEYTPSLENK